MTPAQAHAALREYLIAHEPATPFIMSPCHDAALAGVLPDDHPALAALRDVCLRGGSV